MIRSFSSHLWCIALFALGINVMALAGTPLLLTHQGRLLDASDAPVTGPIDLEFRIYELPTGGAPLWSEMHLDVPVQAGLFTVTLGATTPLLADMLTQSSLLPMERYLEIVVQGAAISPRLRLASVPYAVASRRVSGDIETQDGALSILEDGIERAKLVGHGSVTYVGTWDTASDKHNLLFTDSDSSGLTVADNQGTLIRLQSNVGINELIPDTKLHVGDINRDGYPDIVVASNSNERSIAIHEGNNPFVVSSNDDSTYFAAKHNPLNRPAYMNFTCSITDGRAVLKSEFKNGDIPDQQDRVAMTTTDSSKAEHLLAADFDNTGTPHVATKQYVDGSAAIMEAATTGAGAHSNKANIAATLNGNVVIGALAHTDNSGTPMCSSSIEADASHATSKVSGGKGFYYVVSDASSNPAEGASHVVATDPDLNGIHNGTIWEKVDNTELRSSLGYDTDEDGSDDVGIQASAKLPRSVLKTFFQKSDTPTETQFVVVADSSGTAVDLSNDNQSGCGMSAKENRSYLYAKFQNGDIPTDDNVVQTTCDTDASSLGMRAPTALLTWGTGLAFRVDGDGPSMTMDQDSLPTFSVKSSLSSTECKLQKAIADGDTKLRLSAGQSDCVMQLGDINSDGFAELTTSSGTSGLVTQSSSFRLGRPAVNTALIHTDPSSSSITLSHASSGPGDKPTSAQFGNLIDSYMNLNDDGVTRFSASSSIGIQLRDQFGNLRSSMSTEGTGYFDQKIGVGKTPVEKIDVDGGAYCDGTNWVNASDKNAKENFQEVDGEELLGKIAELDITKWNYKSDKETEHIGPTAQDFKAAFGVGSDDKSISTIDPSGIALAAIKELYSQLKAKDKEIAELRNSNNKDMKDLREELAKLRKELQKK